MPRDSKFAPVRFEEIHEASSDAERQLQKTQAAPEIPSKRGRVNWSVYRVTSVDEAGLFILNVRP